jgi:hypothetical protein
MKENRFVESRDQSKPGVNLLREGLRGTADACPDAEILAAYSERSLDADEAARWELHFSQCADCREQLAAISRAAAADEAQLVAAKSSRWAWLWDWRMLAPVAAMLIVGAVWIEHEPGPIVGEHRATVAMSPQDQTWSASPTQYDAAPRSARAPSPAPKVAPPALALNPSREADALRKQSQPLAASPKPSDQKKDAVLGGAIGNGLPPLARVSPGSNEPLRDKESVSDNANSIASNAPPAPAPASVANGYKAGVGVGIGPNSGVAGGAGVQQKSANAKTTDTSEAQATTLEPTVAATNSRGAATASEARAKLAYSPALAQMALISTGIIPTPDPMVSWRISEIGFVERTTNAGASWKKEKLRSFEPNPQITTGYAPTAKICWLVGRGGVILLTVDGSHWTPIPAPLTTDFVSVTAKDNFSATVTAADGRKFQTDDAGDHWLPVQK